MRFCGCEQVVGTFLRNHNKPLVLGSAGVDGDWFDGSIDELVFYASAISPGRARAHASYANRQLLSQVQRERGVLTRGFYSLELSFVDLARQCSGAHPTPHRLNSSFREEMRYALRWCPRLMRRLLIFQLRRCSVGV